jgi:hypothetical protein
MPDSQPNRSTVILVTRNGMGHADQKLQHKLMFTYFKLLDDSDTLPAVICFYAEGVKLATTGSPVIDTLKVLEAKGVHLVLCSTCLNPGVWLFSTKIKIELVARRVQPAPFLR